MSEPTIRMTTEIAKISRWRLWGAVSFIVWIMICIIFYLYYIKYKEDKINNAYQNIIFSINRTVDDYRTPLFEYLKKKESTSELPTIPSLESFNKLKEICGFLHSAIVGTENEILEHTDKSRLYTTFNKPIYNFIKKSGNVFIEENDNEKIVLLYSDIRTKFGNILVGKLYVALSSEFKDKYLSLNGYIFIAILLAIFPLILFLVLMFLKKFSKTERSVFIGPYKLIKEIAEGGMGKLFLAESDDDLENNYYVIKIALPEIIKDNKALQMFEREALIASQMDHPNIIRVCQYYKEKHAIVMDYIKGKNLSDIMKVVKLSVGQTVYIISEICNGLEYAHSMKKDGNCMEIVHRDIKPANILISFKGEVRLTDFGISKAKTVSSLTTYGEVKGSPGYMSPEQVQGQPDDHRSDIYSLGVVFYEMIIGKNPHKVSSEVTSKTVIEYNTVHRECIPIKELDGSIPYELNEIVMTCLEKNPQNRFQSIKECKERLDALIEKYKEKYGNYRKSQLEKFMNDNFSENETAVTIKKSS